MDSLISKIEQKKAKLGIIGMGYVGLPLALEFCKAGFEVTGIDLDKKKIDSINNGKSYIEDASDNDLKTAVSQGRLHATTDFSILKQLDTVSICVPTPLRKTKDPDISYILSATQEISKYIHTGQLIVLESTTYPGTTEEIILPELESRGLKVGVDFFLAFSPERIDPVNKQFHTRNTPKIIGGITAKCTESAAALYSKAVEKVIPVSSTRAAEMVKLLENTFRAVNIGLVNEIAIICNKLGMDVWEIIDAAATKPFGFMPFYPGPGLGGHCIPVDPHYLSWKLKMFNYNARFIELASEVNTNMPYFVVNKIFDALNAQKKSINGSKILILGVAYKKDVGDVRESPALDVIRLLKEKGGLISYNDPHIPHLHEENMDFSSVDLGDYSVLRNYDCAVIITNHSLYDYKKVVDNAKIIVDTRNATRGILSEKIVKL
ncbi:MAG: nucleotide sugar dehydrogenase [Nitrospirae bacterium]|nr:nucleotide sugar dehydrogenase [Nitrospirota bacterium]